MNLLLDERAARRFWPKVIRQTEGCWIWTAGLNNKGYGQFGLKIDGRHRLVYAHRVAYANLCSPIPEGLQIDHLCRMRCCVNPWHMEPVTAQTNQRRGFGPSGHHARQTHCVHGHEFVGDNVYIRIDNGARQCRACRRVREERERRERGIPKHGPNQVRRKDFGLRKPRKP